MSGHDRRTFLKGIGAGLATVAAGSAAGHPGQEKSHGEAGGHTIHRHDVTENAEMVGFHTLGGVGSETVSGQPDNPLHGMITETWVEGDLAFVSMQSTSAPTGNRGVAILDVSQYTRAESQAELEDAEMTVLSFIGNESEAGTGNDVKVTNDGQYLVYSKQSIGATYGEAASPSLSRYAAPGPNVTGAEIYDISDPGSPEYIGSAQGPNTGFHNCFIHRIGGELYVFGVQGVSPGSSGVHVYRIDPAGTVEFVNYWGDGEIRDGEYATDSTGPLAAGFYCHDLYVHDDPKTGTPVAYVAYWNSGVRALDVSDPENIEQLGVGKMPVAHYAQPAPSLIDGTRVFVGGQEHSSRSNDHSGKVVAFDGDALFEDGVTECPKLDEWTLYENVSYDGYAFSPHNSDITDDGWITQAHYHAGVRFLKIQPPGEGTVNREEWHIAGKRNRMVGGGGGDLTELDAGEQFSGVITPGAQGSTRTTHEFTPGADEGEAAADAIEATLSWGANAQDNDLYLERNISGDPDNPEWKVAAQSRTLGGPESIEAPVETGTRYRFVVETFANAASNYEISATYLAGSGGGGSEPERVVAEDPIAYYRSHVGVPTASKTDGDVSPNFWSAREENGVCFGGSMHTGLYAIAADPMEVGTRTPVDIDVSRRDDGGAFTAGQTNEITFEVETDEAVQLRTRLPEGWNVVGGDSATATDVGDGVAVVFDEEVQPTGGDTVTRTLFVEVASETGSETLGPVGYSTKDDPSLGGKDWESVPGTTDTAVVFGVET